MRRVLSLVTLLSALLVLPAFAILDTNSNGLSDLWERAYNGGELFPADVYPYRPGDDPDGDGWTNEQEAAAGTNPFVANAPDGFVRPLITHIPEVLGVSPEAITITWPTIVGKQYTLMVSPDLVEWFEVEALISNGDPIEYDIALPANDKLFWRVKIEDADSDGDGLTDAEEYLLHTDPQRVQTIDGIPDLWLARYFTSILLAGGPGAIDPDAIPNSDGYTIAQKAYLNLNPNTTNTPATGPIGQETIVNGDFSQPAIGSGNRTGVSNPTWNYWGAGGVTGWSAVVGTNIEFQRIWSKDTGNPYCELKADPKGHYGIKQEVGTHKGTTYLLMLDCRDRPNFRASHSNFNVVTGDEIKKIICKISFTDSTGSDPLTKYIAPGAWTPVAVPFTAINPITWISLVPDIPDRCKDDKTGCLVDNVILLKVEVKDVSNNQVISDTAWIKAHKTDNSGEEAEMPKLEAKIPGLPNTFQVLWKLESRYPRRNGRDDLNVPYSGGDDSGVFTTGDQPWRIWQDIAFSTDPIFCGNETLKFKLIGSSGAFGAGVLEFKIRGENPDDARCKAYIIANQGDVWYAWAIAKHESADSTGYYNQFANGLANGGAGVHGAKGEPFYAPSEGDGWGLFQRDSASGIPVTTQETWSWDRNAMGFLNDEYPGQLQIANNYVNSVQNSNPNTFEEPQFTIKGQAISGRDVLALTWYNGPQGRSNSRLLHFDGSKPAGQRWSLDLPNAPGKPQSYVAEIMDQYNGG